MNLLLASKAGLVPYLLSCFPSRDLEKQCKGPGGGEVKDHSLTAAWGTMRDLLLSREAGSTSPDWLLPHWTSKTG